VTSEFVLTTRLTAAASTHAHLRSRPARTALHRSWSRIRSGLTCLSRWARSGPGRRRCSGPYSRHVAPGDRSCANSPPRSRKAAAARRGQLVLLISIAFLCSGCDGRDRPPSRTSVTVDRTQPLTTLKRLLPSQLGVAKLRKEAYTGRVWLTASPEETFSPEVSVDVSGFLERLHRRASDLSVAWALAGSGPKVVAYRVRCTTAKALVDAYVGAIRERLSPQKLSVAQRLLWGKQITVTSRGIPSRGYLYANDDVLFTAWTDHISPRELAELVPRLP
jgi:hypothetical protein